MRIISGNFRGKKLFLPSDKLTRPLKDVVKESIFNLILHSKKFNLVVENSLILDLFAGTGSFGIECISRKAKKVIFFENYPEAIKILEKNLNLLKNIDGFEIYKQDFFNFFLSNRELNAKFDIIFIDPPYKEKNLITLLRDIDVSNILSKNGIIIIHRHKKEEDEFPKEFQIIEEKTYGISRVLFGICA